MHIYMMYFEVYNIIYFVPVIVLYIYFVIHNTRYIIYNTRYYILYIIYIPVFMSTAGEIFVAAGRFKQKARQCCFAQKSAALCIQQQ